MEKSTKHWNWNVLVLSQLRHDENDVHTYTYMCMRGVHVCVYLSLTYQLW